MNRLLFLLLFCTSSFMSSSQTLEEIMQDYPTKDIDGRSYARCWIPTEYKDSIFLKNILPLYPNRNLLDKIGEHDTVISVVPILPERDTVFINHQKPSIQWETGILTVEAKRKPIILSSKDSTLDQYITTKSLEEYYQLPVSRDSVNVGDTIFEYVSFFTMEQEGYIIPDKYCLSDTKGCVMYLNLSEQDQFSRRITMVVEKIEGKLWARILPIKLILKYPLFKELTPAIHTIRLPAKNIVITYIIPKNVLSNNIRNQLTYTTINELTIKKQGSWGKWREVMCPTFSSSLSIELLLENLISLGYDIDQTRNVTDKVKRAICQFQKDNFLPVGMLDLATVKQLGQLDSIILKHHPLYRF